MATTTAFGYIERDRFIVRHDVPARAVRSFAQDSAGNVWVADQKPGLIRLRAQRHRRPGSLGGLGHKDFATVMIAEPVLGGLWLGFGMVASAISRTARCARPTRPPRDSAKDAITNLRLASDGSLLGGHPRRTQPRSQRYGDHTHRRTGCRAIRFTG